MSAYKYLLTIPYADFGLWDYKRYANSKASSQFKFEYLGKHTINQNKKEILSDRPKEKFGILGVNNKTGMFDAYEELGENINQAYKICENDYIAYNPYRVNVGSIGIKKDELKYRYISPAYVVFSCKGTLNPNFLYMVLKSNYFHSIICDNTSGSVRQNLTFDALSNIKIPLPTLSEQERIVVDYKNRIKTANEMKERSNMLIASVDDVLLKELGVEKVEVIQDNRLLKFIDFKDMNIKWELDNIMSAVMKSLSKCKYKVFPLFKCVDFVNRSWNKKKYDSETFNYIELGGIDEQIGIVETTEVKLKNAPSRATQNVETGDLILGTTRPYLKKFDIIQEKYNEFICSSAFQVIQKSEYYNLEYIMHILKNDVVIKQFVSVMTGALYPAINAEQLKHILIPLPPLEIQNSIVEKILKIKREINELKSKANELITTAQKTFEEEIYGE